MPRRAVLPIALALTLAATAGSAADPEAGRKLARQCSACHGKDGIGTDPEMPNLAGQSALYLEKAIRDFQTGAREDRRMTLIAQSLGPAEIRDLAAWFASFTITVEVPD